MNMGEWIEFLLQQEKYDCVVCSTKINVPWKKKKVDMTVLTTPIFLFGSHHLMPFSGMFSAS